MDRCRNINCLRPIGKTAYYCCNTHDRYCQTCTRVYRCRICNQIPSNKIVMTKCGMCDTTINLLACQCNIVCHPCTFKSPRCLNCKKIYQPISSLNPGPKKVISDTINQGYNTFGNKFDSPNRYNGVEKSFSQSANNFTSINSHIPKYQSKSPQVRKIEQQYCSKCYVLSNLDQLFCNINCGHSFCKKCMVANPKYCPSSGCTALIDQQSQRQYLKLCMECQSPLNLNCQDFGMCQNCINRARQAQKMFQKEPSSVPDLDLQKKISIQNAQQQEELDHKFQQMTITINRPSQPLERAVGANNQTLNSNLSPRGNYLKKLPSINKDLLHPSRVNDDDRASSVAKSVTRSRASSITSQVKKKGRCIFCNIEVEPQFLFSFKQCKRSQNKRHRGCMCCLMKNRSSRLCAGCLQDQQQQLKRKLTYEQLNDTDRIKLNEQNKRTKGLQFCCNCQILLPSKKLIMVENKALCRGCCVK